MKLTQHAHARIEERCGLSLASQEKLAATALAEGYSAENAKGNLKRYLKAFHYRGCSHVRVYGEYVFLFTKQDVLITVVNLPNNLKKLAKLVKQDGRG